MKKLLIASALLTTMAGYSAEFNCQNEEGYKVFASDKAFPRGGFSEVTLEAPGAKISGIVQVENKVSNGMLYSYLLNSDFGEFSSLEILVRHVAVGRGGGRGGGDASDGEDTISAKLIYNGQENFLFCN